VLEAVPARAGPQLPALLLGQQHRGGHLFPGHVVQVGGVRGAGDGDRVGDERVEEPRRAVVARPRLVVARYPADHLAGVHRQAGGLVPQVEAVAAPHHLGADVQGGEQRIERGGGGVQQVGLVEPLFGDVPGLAGDVAVLEVDL